MGQLDGLIQRGGLQRGMKLLLGSGSRHLWSALQPAAAGPTPVQGQMQDQHPLNIAVLSEESIVRPSLECHDNILQV